MQTLRCCFLAVFMTASSPAFSQGIVLKMKDGTIKFINEDELQEFTYSRSETETPEEALARARQERHKSIIGDDCIQMRRALSDFLEVNNDILPTRLSEIVNFEGTEYPLSLRYFKPPQMLDRMKGDEENKKLVEERFILLTPGQPVPWHDLGLDSTRAEQENAKKVFFIITNPDFVDGKYVMAMNGLGQMLPFKDYAEVPGIEKYSEIVNDARERAQQGGGGQAATRSESK